MHNPFVSGKSRSLAGFVLAVAIAPFLLALTACLKVPIGDPEKSRIDPALTGVWLAAKSDTEDAALWLLEPYDARTWLVSVVIPETAESIERGVTPQVNPDALTLLEQKAGVPSELDLFKAWLVSIGAMRFLVLEPKMLVNAPKEWMTFAVVNGGKDTLELRLIGPGIDELEDARTSAEAEAIIAHNIGNPKLLASDPIVLVRVPAADFGRVKEVLKDFKAGN